LVAGTGISITTNDGTDTVTITNTVTASGATAFTGLSDRSDLTVDQFYLPAITRLNVTANGFTAYRFDQYGTTDDPTIYAISGTTIAFNLTGASGHPFLIRFSGANYDVGLVHVTTAGVVTTGSDAQGKASGTLYWKIPAGISGTYGYLCGSHASMNGTITVKDISAI
jgi:plastocyanin